MLGRLLRWMTGEQSPVVADLEIETSEQVTAPEPEPVEVVTAAAAFCVQCRQTLGISNFPRKTGKPGTCHTCMTNARGGHRVPR